MTVNKENIRYFVRDILGCGCPEEVFNIIDPVFNIKIDNVLLRGKINIGNRLLIYVIEGNGLNLNSLIPFLIDYGKKERDSKGFNRLRIVLVFEDPEAVKEQAISVFQNYNKDEKIHLHLIKKSTIPPFYS
jgi:hypothetical protein